MKKNTVLLSYLLAVCAGGVLANPIRESGVGSSEEREVKADEETVWSRRDLEVNSVPDSDNLNPEVATEDLRKRDPSNHWEKVESETGWGKRDSEDNTDVFVHWSKRNPTSDWENVKSGNEWGKRDSKDNTASGFITVDAETE